MNTELVLNPCEIANGETSRNDIKTSINDSAKANGLTAIDQVRFYRELSKGSSEAEKIEDEKGNTITDLAVAQAKKLPEYKRALKEGKKEFLWNGCYYQIREDMSVDMAAVATPEEAEVWLAAKEEYDAIEKEIAKLRKDQKPWKAAMDAEEEKYIAEHPKCKSKKKPTLVCL